MAEYALSSHAIYSVAGQRIMGKWKVIDALKGMYGKKVHAHMGKQGDRPVLILADKNPSSFDRLIFIEVDGNNIKKITSTPELGTLSLAEGFSYRKDSAYIILKIMSYMIYENDCSGSLTTSLKMWSMWTGTVKLEDAMRHFGNWKTCVKIRTGKGLTCT